MTVDEVAASAGVGKATVYRRWARKEDLAVAAMEQLYRDELPPPDTGSLRGDLQVAFATLLAFVNSPAGADYLRTTVRESMRDPRIAALYRAAGDHALAVRQQIVERAVARGEVRPGAHVQAALEFLGGLLTARAVAGKPMPAVEEAEALVELVLHGIASSE